MTLTRYLELMQLVNAIRDTPGRPLADYAEQLDLSLAAASRMRDELLDHGVIARRDGGLRINGPRLRTWQHWAFDHAGDDDINPTLLREAYRQRGHVLLAHVFAIASHDLQLGNAQALEWFESPRAGLWADILGHNAELMRANARRLFAERDPEPYVELDYNNAAHLRYAYDRYVSGEWTPGEVCARFGKRAIATLRSRWSAIGLISRDQAAYEKAKRLHADWQASGLSLAKYEQANGMVVNCLSPMFRRFGLRNAPVVSADVSTTNAS